LNRKPRRPSRSSGANEIFSARSFDTICRASGVCRPRTARHSSTPSASRFRMRSSTVTVGWPRTARRSSRCRRRSSCVLIASTSACTSPPPLTTASVSRSSALWTSASWRSRWGRWSAVCFASSAASSTARFATCDSRSGVKISASSVSRTRSLKPRPRSTGRAGSRGRTLSPRWRRRPDSVLSFASVVVG
jgi:hypothetical protein